MRVHRPFVSSRRLVAAVSVSIAVATLPGFSASPVAGAEEAAASQVDEEPTSDVVDDPVPNSELAPVPVPELTTATSTAVQLADGSFDATLSTVPVNYLDESGEWQEIDNNLVDAPGSTYAVENAGNDVTVSIPADASTAPVRLESDGAWVAMKMDGLDDAPQVNDASASFDDVEGADSVTYTAIPTGVKEDIVLETPPTAAAGQLEYSYAVTASPGLSADLTASGIIEFADTAGDVAFTVPVGNMFDAADPDPAYSTDVAYDLEPRASGGWTLTVTPDMDWLRSPERVYPVTIDPTVEAIDNRQPTASCWITTANPDTSNCSGDYLRVGRSSSGQMRALLKFNIADIPDDATINGGHNSHIDTYLRADLSPTGEQGSYAMYQAGKPWANGATWNSPNYGGQTWAGGGAGAKASDSRLEGANQPNAIRTWWGMGAAVDAWHDQSDNGGPSGVNNGLVLKLDTAGVTNTLYFSSGRADGGVAPKLHVNYTLPDPAPDNTSAAQAGDRPFWTYEERNLTDKITAKVNVGNGNLLITANDAKLAGIAGWDLALTRYYNSAVRSDASLNMGRGWSNSLGNSIRLTSGGSGTLADQNLNASSNANVRFYGPSNYRVVFNKGSGGNYNRTGAGLNGDLSYDSAKNEYTLKWFDESKYIFNGTGRLVTTKDKNGNALQFTYDTNGRLSRVDDTRGRSAVPVYGAKGGNNIITSISFRNAGGQEMLRWRYDYSDQIGKTGDIRIDKAGVVLVSSRLEVVNPANIGPGGSAPNTAVASDPNVGAATSYGYDPTTNRLITISDAREVATNDNAEGGLTRITYYGDNNFKAGRVKSLTRGTSAANGDKSTLSFDYSDTIAAAANGVCTNGTEGRGGDTTRGAAARAFVDGEQAGTTDTTKYCLDDKNRVLRTTDALGVARGKSWSPNSNVATADMAGLGDSGDQYEMTYDSDDNAEKGESAGGTISTADYGTTDASNNANNSNAGAHQTASVSGEDSNGAKISWNYSYDDNHNLIRVRSGGTTAGDDNTRVRYNYCWTNDGQIARIDPVVPTGSLINPSAKDAGMSTNPKDDPTSPNRCRDNDQTGQGNDTVFTYNGRGELTQVDKPAAGDLNYTYDNLSRIATVTDARGAQTRYTYDGLDHVVQIHHSKPSDSSLPAQVVNQTYDLAGNLTQVGDLNGANTFVFDELNRRTQETGQDPSGTTAYSYDDAGNVKTIAVSAETAAGLEPTVYEYNAINLVTSIDDQRPGAAKIQITYDRKNNKPKKTVFPMASGADVTQRVIYDNDGKPACIYSFRDNGPSNDDERTEPADCPVADLGGLFTYMGYDYEKDPDGAGGAPAFETSQVQKLTEKGGRTTTYQYADHLKRLDSATTDSATTNGTQLRKFSYAYDRHSNLTKTVVTGGTPSLDTGTRWAAFDQGDQICRSLNEPNPSSNVNLDCASPAADTTWTADQDGNLRTATGAGPLAGLEMTYNLLGQTVTIDPPGATGPETMAYDGTMQDRRTQAGNTALSYGFAGVAAQNTPASNGNVAHGELFVRDPDGNLYGMIDTATSAIRYYLTDKQQSVMATVNNPSGASAGAGEVIRYLYEPYGNTIRSWTDNTPATGSGDGAETPSAAPASDHNPWRYASGYHEKGAGLIKFGTRYYVPSFGTWTQPDPKPGAPAEPLALNEFSYSWSDPINRSDRDGRYPFEDVLSVDSWEDALTVGAVTYGTLFVTIPAGVGCTGVVTAVTAGWGAIAGGAACFAGTQALGGWLKGQVYDEIGYEY